MCEPSINPLPQWRPPEHGRRYRSFFGEACPYLAVLGSLSIRVIMAWPYLKYLRGATVLLLIDLIKRHQDLCLSLGLFTSNPFNPLL